MNKRKVLIQNKTKQKQNNNKKPNNIIVVAITDAFIIHMTCYALQGLDCWACSATTCSMPCFSFRCCSSLAQWLRRPPRERKIPGSNPACAGIFSGSSHTSDFKIGTPVAALPGAWRSRVSTGTGRPGVGILGLGEVESWICSFFLSVAARKIFCADPSLRYTSLLLGR